MTTETRWATRPIFLHFPAIWLVLRKTTWPILKPGGPPLFFMYLNRNYVALYCDFIVDDVIVLVAHATIIIILTMKKLIHNHVFYFHFSFNQYSFHFANFFLRICWLTDNFSIISTHASTSLCARSHGTIFSESVLQKNICSLTNMRPRAYSRTNYESWKAGHWF